MIGKIEALILLGLCGLGASALLAGLWAVGAL